MLNYSVAELRLNKDSKHVDIINKARLRIRESLEGNLTIQEIAQELGISYSSFRKLFKEHTGFAPALYQQNLKLQRAKELLSTTDDSIKEIAYRLNFESPDYFSSKFKSQTGMKPSDFRNMYSVAELRLNKDSKHVDIINKARLRIRESLEGNLTIQEIAQELGISYSSFRKLFKEHTGFAPALYQQNLKLQRAKELLSTTDDSIKEIAYRLNFESPDYFSSKFKSQTGMKPSDFRNMNR